MSFQSSSQPADLSQPTNRRKRLPEHSSRSFSLPAQFHHWLLGAFEGARWELACPMHGLPSLMELLSCPLPETFCDFNISVKKVSSKDKRCSRERIVLEIPEDRWIRPESLFTQQRRHRGAPIWGPKLPLPHPNLQF